MSVHAVQNLEGGKGVSLTTLLRVAKALKRLDWIETIAPQVLTNPLTLPKHSHKRQRASQDKIERFKTAKIRRSLADMIAQCDLKTSPPADLAPWEDETRRRVRRSLILRTDAEKRPYSFLYGTAKCMQPGRMPRCSWPSDREGAD